LARASDSPNPVAGLQLATAMAEMIAGIHVARAEHLAESPDGELYTGEDMARARASVAAGLAVSFRLRADEEPTPVTIAPWWRRWWRR